MKRLFGFMLLVHMACGCATTRAVGAIAKSCEPSTDQEAAILDAAAKPTQAGEALAAMDALGFALCVLQRGADEAIASLRPKPGTTALALSAASYSPVLDNLTEWRKRHP